MTKKTYSFLVIGLITVLTGFLMWPSSLPSTKDTIVKHSRHTYKADKPDEFIKLYNELRTRSGHTQPEYTSGYKLKALHKAKQGIAAVRTTATYNFIERGPANVPGRTRGLVVDPDDPNQLTWFAGSVGGGIWKTTDGGSSWISKTDNLPNLAISWIVMAASDHNIMYAGTGEGWGSSVGFIKGSGVYKSTDKGETWNLLGSTVANDDFQIVNRLVVDPNNPNIVLAATSNDPLNSKAFNSGIFKSTDGGITWSRKFSGQSWVQQIVATPGDFNTLYATVRANGVYKSIDAGETWSNASFGINADGRIEMAVSPVDTARLYASVLGSLSGTGADLYVSDDAGANWQVVTEKNTGDDIDFLGGQGWYDNTILAHPFNADIVYVGGVNIWKFKIELGTVLEGKQFLGANENNTNSFLSLVNFGATYYGGKIDTGDETAEDFVSVEVRFGPDGQGGYLKQKAHRFTIPAGQGSGVPAADYTYHDYVDVPFQVWDITNNRQLMVAFRDQQEDGKFNLLPLNTDIADALNNSREYIYISNITYNDTAPDPNMAANGNHEFRNLYFFWPYLAEGAIWDEANLPASNFAITWDTIEKRLYTRNPVTDAYSENGGVNNYSQSTGSTIPQGVHPDHHNIVPIITDMATQRFRLLVANDGGVYSSDAETFPGETNGSWSLAGLTYNTSQLYAVDKAPGQSRYIGGMQDNGTWMSKSNSEGSAVAEYKRATSGDGFGCAWNYSDISQVIATIYYNDIRKSTNGGSGFLSATSGLTDVGGDKAPFITEIENLPSDPDVVFTAGVSGVWWSNDFANRWQLAPIDTHWSLASTMKVRISHANSHIIWAGTAMDETTGVNLHVSIDEGKAFLPVNNYTAVELGRISGLATHPVLDSTAFALFSFAKGPKILRTNNLGQSWYDISGFGSGTVSANGFPDVAIYDLLIMPYDTAIMWAGTEIGVFESTDAGSSWHILNANIPAVSVWQMKIVDNEVVFATHGRGIWSVSINDLPGQVYLPKIIGSAPSLAGELLLDLEVKSPFDSTFLYIDGNLFAKINQPTSAGKLQLATNYTASKTGTAYVRSFYIGLPYVSHTYNFEYRDYNNVVDSYQNDFETATQDFIGDGFTEKSISGFANKAIHTPHFYSNNTTSVYTLYTPIKVRTSDALINFQEVVLVEPGEAGAAPGSPEFNDYVVVQGSLDGITWINLLDEYDASSFADWQSAFANQESGDDQLYKFRSIDLLNNFAPGDVVVIRFLMVTNQFNNGWGWSIDKLKIQTDDVVTGLESEKLQTAFSVFPNPLTSSTLNISGPEGLREGLLNMFDLNGKKVLSKPFNLLEGKQINVPHNIKDGVYTVEIVTENLKEAHKIILSRN